MTNSIDQRSVLFVCLGNICRSPAAEGIMLDLLDRESLQSQWQVDSAGTAGYHIGKKADPRMRLAAERRGIELASRSRQLTVADIDAFDLVIAMDRENYSDIQRLHRNPTAEVKLLSDYLDENWPTDVPDPYYGGDEGFEYVLDMLTEACPAIISEFTSNE